MINKNKSMLSAGRICYFYLIYRIHYYLNIVTENEGKAGVVLVLRLLSLQIIYIEMHLNGLEKFTNYIKINKNHYGLSLLNNENFNIDHGIEIIDTRTSRRIGIKKAWRFNIDI